MKKVTKLELTMFIFILLGCAFGLAAWITETSVGHEVLWLRAPATLFMFIPTVPILGYYCSDIIVRLQEEHKAKKEKKDANK